MKKTFKFLIITISFILLSCSTESNNNDDGNQHNNISNLVKREYISNNLNLEYRYANNNLDRIINVDNTGDNNSETKFTYDSNNVIVKNFQSNSFNYSSITNYSFNGNNKLLSVISNINQPNNTINPKVTVTQKYAYNGNTIIIDISSSVGDSRTVTLELNNYGLVNKLTESNYYVLIDYDSNQNISEIKIYDNNDNLTNSSIYSYDENPNPFFGQLTSIYLPTFLNAFDDAYYNEFVWEGYEGYYFPFLKNNIISVIENGILDKKYIYKYNDQNYPTNVIEVFNENETQEFDIEYE